MSENLFKGLEDDKEFIEKLCKQTTDEGIINVFAEKNITLSDDDLKDLKALVFICVNNNGKLSDEVVEKVSGGGAKKWLSKNWHRLVGVACGVTATGALIYEGHRLANSAIATMDATTDAMYTTAHNIDKVGDSVYTGVKKTTGVVQGLGNAVHREGLAGIVMGATTGLGIGFRAGGQMTH